MILYSALLPWYGWYGRYRTRLLSSQGGLRRSVAAELHVLAAITSRALIRASTWAAAIMTTSPQPPTAAITTGAAMAATTPPAPLPPAATAAAAAKAVVSLSPYAHELLMRFLHTGGCRMLPLLAIVNSHIDVQVVEGPARGAAAAAAAAAAEADEMEDGEWGWDGEVEALGEGAGPAPADAASAVLINRAEVKLGLLQVGVDYMPNTRDIRKVNSQSY